MIDDIFTEHVMHPPEQWGQKNKYIGKEDGLQSSCYKILCHIPGNPLGFHIANERKTKVGIAANGKKFSYEGNLLKAKGVIAGNCDMLICHARGGYFGAALELKTKGNNLSEEQKYVLDWYHREGYYTGLIWSVDGFVSWRDWYFNLTPTAKHINSAH